MTTMTNTLPKPKRRHRAVVHGTGIERRAKKPTRLGSLYEAAEDFNEAFDTVFAKARPWLLRTKGWTPDPLLKPKTKTALPTPAA